MTWIAVIGIFLLVIGRIVADAHMDDLSTKIGKLMYGLAYILFTFLFIVSLIGGIQQLSR